MKFQKHSAKVHERKLLKYVLCFFEDLQTKDINKQKLISAKPDAYASATASYIHPLSKSRIVLHPIA